MLNKTEIKFLRYTAKGSDLIGFKIPQKYIDRYPDADTCPMTKRNRVWADKGRPRINFGEHLVQKLLDDGGFMVELTNSLHKETKKWFEKSFTKFTTNFYFIFESEETTLVESFDKLSDRQKRRTAAELKKIDDVDLTPKKIVDVIEGAKKNPAVAEPEILEKFFNNIKEVIAKANSCTPEEAVFEAYRWVLTNTTLPPRDYFKIFSCVPLKDRKAILRSLGHKSEEDFKKSFSKALTVYKQSNKRRDEEI